MTEQEARLLNLGDKVIYLGAAPQATLTPNLTVGSVYVVGGPNHGQRTGSNFFMVGLEQDDNGVDSWCYPEEISLLGGYKSGCGGSCGNGNCKGNGACSPDDDCFDSEEFCKRLWQPTSQVEKEPPCKCPTPSNHEKDCAWKKWKDKQRGTP